MFKVSCFKFEVALFFLRLFMRRSEVRFERRFASAWRFEPTPSFPSLSYIFPGPGVCWDGGGGRDMDLAAFARICERPKGKNLKNVKK
jgi:hypothetical protein